jgi:hypothetical protein
MNDRSVYLRDARVIEVLVASPVATIEPGARVTESIVNATVEAHRRPPMAERKAACDSNPVGVGV